jgi:exonuclease III
MNSSIVEQLALKLHLITYNVNSLNLEEEIHKLRLYNQSLTSHVNIILLQGHNHRDDKVANLGN